jgi:protein transport protein SEC20
MSRELGRSEFAKQTLEESTAQLATLSENYSNLDNLLSNSKNLLSSLLRTQKSDTWYLETAMYILMTTVIWLIFRRFMYGPLWWFVWKPLKLFWWISSSLVSAVGFGGAAAKSLDSTSVAVTQSTVASATGVQPTFMKGANRLNIQVGGGGRGAPGEARPPPRQEQEQHPEQTSEDESYTEQIGKIIDGGQEEDGNPKKRMWEEDKEARKQAEKDEL